MILLLNDCYDPENQKLLKDGLTTLNGFDKKETSEKIATISYLNKNKEEVTEYTLELAKSILRYRNGDSNNKTVRKNLIEKELFEAKSKKGFIEQLTAMIKDLDENDLFIIKALKDEIHLMTNEEFGYFSTLLKFDYAFQEKQS